MSTPERPRPSRVVRAKAAGSSALSAVVVHAKKHLGMGIVCSVAYFDPGNWSVDLQAGSDFGYRPMLFVVLMAGLGAIIVQTLACKLGCITGLDLATHCRLMLHDHPRHPRLVRYLVLYPLYALSEIAVIATDLAELLGSAIGFCLLIPVLPLWAGVVLTAADVLVFLFFSDPSKGQGRPVKMFEYTIIVLVAGVFGCFIALLAKANPDWSQVFMGYIPSKGLFQAQPDAVYAAVGILGATVMPHALFLGSSLAAQDRVSISPPPAIALPGSYERPQPLFVRLKKLAASYFTVSPADRDNSPKDYRSKHGERENNSLLFIRQHLTHGIVDVISSLAVFAVPINSAILILAAAVFYKGPGEKNDTPAGLFEAHDLIKARLGNAAAIIFALALICAGQTSSITVTLAGQIVSEGFIEWKVSPMLRRLITRSMSLIPSVVVAVAVGKDGISTLLVASQVLLSVVLPFVMFPLVYLTSSQVVMRVRKPPPLLVTDSVEALSIPEENHPSAQVISAVEVERPQATTPSDTNDKAVVVEQKIETTTRITVALDEYIDYSNGRVLMYLAYALWSVVLCANAYAIVILFVK